MRLRIVESSNQSIVFGDVVGHTADVFFQLGDDFAARVANYHSVGSRSGIAARSAVDIGAIGGGDGLHLRRRISEQSGAAGSWRAFDHQEDVDADDTLPEPAAEFGAGMGSRV